MPKIPPRYVPTLTQVVQHQDSKAMPDSLASSEPQAESLREVPQPPAAHTTAQQLHQALLLSTQQYLAIELQKRIREAVSQLALEQAHKMFEQIQPLLEATISQVVQEALEQAVRQSAKHGS